MGKITINEIHKSLFGYIQAVSDESLETKDKTIVGAINELIQNSNSNKTEINNLTNEISNGKQLIANAIGEPLDSNDTFSAMSNDINGLLSTFKTNMMNNGVVVEGTDKFKQLIDKLATLADNEGKGIKYANGICTRSSYSSGEYGSGTTYTINIETNLTFVPDIIFVRMGYNNVGSTSNVSNKSNLYISNLMEFNEDYTAYSDINKISINNITKEGFQINVTTSRDSIGLFNDWYAIGVGEESNSGLDIISAAELPTTGKENQICVITSNPTNNYVVTHDYDYSDTTNIILYNGSKNSAPLINIVSGSVTQQYYITKIIQNDKYKLLESYYWSNNQWNSLTKSYVIIVQDGKVQNTNIIGGIKTQSYVMNYDNVSGSLLTPYSSTYSDSYVGATTTKKIDFGKYTTVTITAKVSNGSRYLYVGTATDSGNMAGESTVYLDNFFTKYVSKNLTSTSYVDLTFDISGYTGEYYLAFGFSKASSGGASNVYIKDIKLS